MDTNKLLEIKFKLQGLSFLLGSITEPVIPVDASDAFTGLGLILEDLAKDIDDVRRD